MVFANKAASSIYYEAQLAALLPPQELLQEFRVVLHSEKSLLAYRNNSIVTVLLLYC